MGKLPVLNNSRIKAFRKCARFHFFAYVLALRPLVKSDAQRFGSVFHKALEAWWLSLQHGRGDVAIDLALDVIAQSELDAFDKVRAEVLMAFYDGRWLDEPFEVIGVERAFVAPLVNPSTGARSRTWDLGGTLDVLVRNTETGEVWVVEHKTSGEDLSPESTYWDRLRMDPQVSTYLIGGQELLSGGEPSSDELAGCIYDVIGKPQIRPLQATPEESRKYTKEKKCTQCKGLGGHDAPDDPKGYVTCEVCEGKGKIAPRLYANQREGDETPEEFKMRLLEHIEDDPSRYLNRAEIVRLEDDEREAAADIWMTARNIRDAERMGFHPRNPDACHLYRRTCEYWQVCAGQADIHDPALFAPMVDPTQERTA